MTLTPTSPMARGLALLLAGLVALLAVLGARAAEAQEYRIRPGDVLRIEVIEDPTLNRSVLVPPDGRITVPLAGAVVAGGNTVEGVQASLSSQLAPNFAAPPSVFVSIERLAPATPVAPLVQAAPAEPPTIEVHVLGEVANSGRLGLEPGATVLEAFAEMGGFTPFAATRRIQLRRVDPATNREVIYELDYDAMIAGRSPNGRVTVLDGDVFVVPERRLFE